MPSGGARSRSGPAPDPNALRRSRDGKQWTKLAPDARAGKPSPSWPLPEDPTQIASVKFLSEKVEETRQLWAEAADKREATRQGKQLEKYERELALTLAINEARNTQELALWERLWQLPQASVWEADRVHDHVALYVRVYFEAQRIGASASDRTLAARLAGELLLTIPAMHAAHYVIDESLAGASPADLTGEAAARPAPRNRFRIVREPGAPEESA